MIAETMTREDVAACERRVIKALRSNPLVRLMVSALDAAGCPLTPSRHLACEECSPGVKGGFDAKVNQVVVCSNSCLSDDSVGEILFHELIHMYDYCAAKVDFGNLKQLACTEVRAANLAHCMDAWSDGSGSRESCVKRRAAASVRAIMPSAGEEGATKAVDEVFAKCYADLEPVGRLARQKKADGELALAEFLHFKDLLLSKRRPDE